MALDPVTAGLEVVNTVGGALIKHFFPDPAQAAAAEQKMAELEKSGELAKIAGQLEINKQEAASSNWFVAGWRPYVGWVCGTGLLYVAIVELIIRFVAQVMFGYKGPFPLIDTSLTMQVLLGMLGLGYLRTSEKKAGVARS